MRVPLPMTFAIVMILSTSDLSGQTPSSHDKHAARRTFGGLEIDDRSYDAWRERLRPSEAEAAWRKIAWRPTFAAGVLEADRTSKPLLVWVMNGHPFGYT